jgi:hypothetical protein
MPPQEGFGVKPTTTSSYTYHTIDWLGWGALILLTAILLFTGTSIRAGLVNNHHPVLGEWALLIFGAIALAWIVIFLSFRVLVRVITSPERVTIAHGPWRHHIAWSDVTRVSEWSAMQDGIPGEWIAIWSVEGMRLQVRQDLVGDFHLFRNDLMHHLTAISGVPPEVTNIAQPLIVEEDTEGPMTTWLSMAAISAISGLGIWFSLPLFRLLGILIIILAIISLLMAAITYFFHQQLIISPEGIGTVHGPFRTHISWDEVYSLEREKDQRRGGVLGILGRGLLMILYRLDRRSGVVLGPIRPHSTICVRGGSAVKMTVQERHYRHPEWIRARLRVEIDAMYARAKPQQPPRITPLAKTGPLEPGTTLPDPVEGDSALWLRESAEFDPFRGQ